MKKILSSIILSSFIPLNIAFSQAPDIEWQNTIGGNISDELHSIQQTTDGGYILGGTLDLGIPGSMAPGPMWIYWVLKLNGAGDIVWQKKIGSHSNLYSIEQTTDGGYILGGYSSSGISDDKTEENIGDYDYWVVKLEADTPLGVEQIQLTSVIETFTVLPAYPNPFNPSTTIRYGLDTDSYVTVDIYDISGKLISTLQNEYQTQGEHSITWNGTDNSGNKVGGGVYFYQVKAGDFVQTKKMVLMK